MKYALRALRHIRKAEGPALWRGLMLAVLVMLAGTALLGLSGWFIIASGVAGLATGWAGVAASGINVFLPSAGVRGLALLRTLTRYGERLLTHDATLRALALLRVRVLEGFARLPLHRLQALRAGAALNRITADVDALDGIVLALFVPVVAGSAVLIAAVSGLWALAGPVVALSVGAGILGGAIAAGARVLARARRPARLGECAHQALRLRLSEMMRGQEDLLFAGRLAEAAEHALEADRRQRGAWLETAAHERAAAGLTGLGGLLAAGAALLGGALLVLGDAGSAAVAGLGFFAALGLAEISQPLLRGMVEWGRMEDAARRIFGRSPQVEMPEAPGETAEENAARQGESAQPAAAAQARSVPPLIECRAVAIARPESPAHPILEGIGFEVCAGESLGLTGPSGGGKSTLLTALAGELPPVRGEILLEGRRLGLPGEAERRRRIGLLLQRAALIGGTIGENLALAAPQADAAAMEEVLRAVDLWRVLAPAGGLALRLGEAGSGLSGGEKRRLALARVLIRRPALLLLDEPCEGLDSHTARRVLSGLRQYCPQAAIVIATHRREEAEWCDRRYRIAP